MKKFLTEKNLMWAAMAVLAFLHFCPAFICSASKDCCSDTKRQRMSQMRERMGPQMEKGREAWKRKSESRSGAPKNSK
tara:strand:- start:162 stop:395 length:234 start_codon:yes stop_codon:yes gene_type:complete